MQRSTSRISSNLLFIKGGCNVTLKVNASYTTATGFLIPRSHFKEEKGTRWCVVQVLTGGVTHYTSRHMTMTAKDLRKALALTQKERVEIV